MEYRKSRINLFQKWYKILNGMEKRFSGFLIYILVVNWQVLVLNIVKNRRKMNKNLVKYITCCKTERGSSVNNYIL